MQLDKYIYIYTSILYSSFSFLYLFCWVLCMFCFCVFRHSMLSPTISSFWLAFETRLCWLQYVNPCSPFFWFPWVVPFVCIHSACFYRPTGVISPWSVSISYSPVLYRAPRGTPRRRTWTSWTSTKLSSWSTAPMVPLTRRWSGSPSTGERHRRRRQGREMGRCRGRPVKNNRGRSWRLGVNQFGCGIES